MHCTPIFPRRRKRLILRCGKALMLFRLRGPLSFGAAKGISARIN